MSTLCALVSKDSSPFIGIEVTEFEPAGDSSRSTIADQIELFPLIRTYDLLCTYVDRYDEFGGTKWLELAYGALLHIDYLSRSWNQKPLI